MPTEEALAPVPAWGVLSAAAAPVVLAAGYLYAASLTPGFQPVSQPLSDLGAANAGTRWLMAVTLMLVGVSYIVTALGLRPADTAGRWLLGFPSWTNTDGYRRVHAAHHRDEFGPDEPDIALYIGYPIERASFRRKMMRDATGRTGIRLLRDVFAAARSKDQRSRRTFWKIMLTQAILLATAIASGHWWLYPFFWLAPYLTAWRLINRLRSIAEHGGMQLSSDRRETTHAVRQLPVARFMLVPYRIGLHLPHHVDSGVPFRNLPKLNEALREAGYLDDTIEYQSYPALWRALRR